MRYLCAITTSVWRQKHIACLASDVLKHGVWVVLKNKVMMQRGLRFFTLMIACIVACMLSTAHAALLAIDPNSVEAQAWSIYDPQSGQVIAEHNANEQRAPASMTKMMVAFIAHQEIRAGRLHLNDVITTGPIVHMVQWDESQMRLKVGEKISVDNLLAGLIIMSANDAAVVLAERISGNVPAFVTRMNREAKALGMHNTHFTNPAGVSNPQHYSTAHDMSLLAQALVTQTPEYLHYSKQAYFRFGEHFHRATNLALKMDPSVDGLKTGFTKAAGFNLALTAQRPTGQYDLPNRRLIVVVMGCANGRKRAEVAQHLLDLAFSYTRNETALKKNQVIADVPLFDSTYRRFKLETQQPRLMTTSLYDQPYLIDLKAYDPLAHRIRLNTGNGSIQVLEPLSSTQTNIRILVNQPQLIAPIQQVVNIATIQIYQNNRLIHHFNVAPSIQVEKANLIQRAWYRVAAWLGLLSNADLTLNGLT